MLLHTEYSLLSLLHTQDGVVHHHGLFQVSGCLSPPPPNPPPWAGTCCIHICTLSSSPMRPSSIPACWVRQDVLGWVGWKSSWAWPAAAMPLL